MKIIQCSEEIFKTSKLLRVDGRNVSKDPLNPLNSRYSSYSKGSLIDWPAPPKTKTRKHNCLVADGFNFHRKKNLLIGKKPKNYSRLQRKTFSNLFLV